MSEMTELTTSRNRLHHDIRADVANVMGRYYSKHPELVLNEPMFKIVNKIILAIVDDVLKTVDRFDISGGKEREG